MPGVPRKRRSVRFSAQTVPRLRRKGTNINAAEWGAVPVLRQIGVAGTGAGERKISLESGRTELLIWLVFLGFESFTYRVETFERITHINQGGGEVDKKRSRRSGAGPPAIGARRRQSRISWFEKKMSSKERMIWLEKKDWFRNKMDNLNVFINSNTFT